MLAFGDPAEGLDRVAGDRASAALADGEQIPVGVGGLAAGDDGDLERAGGGAAYWMWKAWPWRP